MFSVNNKGKEKMFTRNKMACALAFSLLPFINTAMADDTAANSVEIQFNGQVKAPTCTINDNTSHSVVLPEINLQKVEALTTGQATADQQKRFQINVSCANKATENDIQLTIEGNSASATPEVLSNSSNDAESAHGVGFELFSEQDQNTPLQVNSVVPASDYIDRLNQGDDNINFIVEYAKQDATVTAGNVTSSATFAFTYK